MLLTVRAMVYFWSMVYLCVVGSWCICVRVRVPVPVPVLVLVRVSECMRAHVCLFISSSLEQCVLKPERRRDGP